jgi:DNA-binding CsgD family transcriptional regulator
MLGSGESMRASGESMRAGVHPGGTGKNTYLSVLARSGGHAMVSGSEGSKVGRSCCCQAEHFTEVEIQVLCLVADGLSNLEIAQCMSVSGHTVDRHVTQMLRRSGARNRAGLVSLAFRAGVLIADGHALRPSGRRCLLA